MDPDTPGENAREAVPGKEPRDRDPGNQTGYAVREGTLPEDSEAILALWDLSFEALRGSAGRDRLGWLYGDENPAGEGRLMLLEDESGRPVGFKGLGTRAFSLRGKESLGAIMADFTVHPEHRSLGPALHLLRETMTRGRRGFGFLYGFPNPSAEAVFKRAGLRPVALLRRYGHPLRSRKFLRGRVPDFVAAAMAPFVDFALFVESAVARLLSSLRFRVDEPDGFDDRFDGLWKETPGLSILTGTRSRAALQWRFQDVPKPDRISVITAESRKSGELRGYVVWRSRGSQAHVMDVFSAGDPAVVTGLLRTVRWKARRRGCEALSLEFAGPPSLEEAVRRAGFLRREANPLYFVQGDEDAVDPDADWYLTSFDRD